MLGIIGAMEVEIESLKQKMNNVMTRNIAGMAFCSGMLNNKKVVVVRSGVGKVNAALCTQALVDNYDVKAIINTGIAGSLKSEINIGDIVLSTDMVQHDMDATGFGYDIGVIPQMEVSNFGADDNLRKLALKCCQQVNPDISVFEGRIVSGDQFVSDKEKKNWIFEHFQGYCTEMEGAAIAQGAYLNGVPFLIVRAISDKADDSATMDYPEFEKMAVANSVKLIEAICNN